MAIEVHQVRHQQLATSVSTSNCAGRGLGFRPPQSALPPLQSSPPGAPPLAAATTASPLQLPMVVERNESLPAQTNAPASVHERPASPGRHLPFVVSTRFATVTSSPANIIVTPSLATNTTLIPTGAVWRYLDTGVDPGMTWTQPDFNDGSWRIGRAILGYNNDNEATVVRFGPDPANKYTTYWFRRSFVADDHNTFNSLTLRLLRDDGAAVYLNGTEVFRNNLPSGPLSPATLASGAIGGADETNYATGVVSLASLRAGTNMVAVEVHQSATNSSDLSFDLELRGVQVWLAPYILQPLSDQLAAAGTSVALEAGVGGSGPLRYQWLFNGTNLPGATNGTLLLTNLTLTQSGAYSLRVSNPAGSAVSSAALLRVLTPPRLQAQWQLPEGAALTFAAPTAVSCSVLVTTNFADWLVLTNFPGTGGPVRWADPEAASLGCRFYRLRLDP